MRYNKFILLALLCSGVANAGDVVIWNGSNALFLNSGSIIAPGIPSELLSTNASGLFGPTTVSSPLTYSSSALGISAFGGDSGSGGTSGIVPAPAAGQGADGAFLAASGSFVVPDLSKPFLSPFALINQTAGPVGTLKYENVAICNNHAYVVGGQASPSTVAIYNIKDQVNPVLEGLIVAAGGYNVQCVNVSGNNYVFIPASGATGKVYVYNVNNNSVPVAVTGSPFTMPGSPGSVYDGVYANGYYYAATQNTGLDVVDYGGGLCGGTFTAPVNCYQEGGAKSFGVAVNGNYVYTTQYVTSGFATRQIKSWALTGAGTLAVPSLIQSLQVTTAGEALGVSISGNTAFVSVAATGVNAIDLIDITSPASMSNLSVFTPSGALNSGTVALQYPAFTGNFMVVPSGSGTSAGSYIDYVDISNRSSPVLISTRSSGVANAVMGGAAFDPIGGYLWVADYGVAGGSLSTLDLWTLPYYNPTFGNVTADVITAIGGFVGSLTGHASLDLAKANNLSDVANATTALNNILPSQTGQTGNYLTTNGTNASWANVPAGFTNPMTTLGDIIFENSTPAAARLAGNTSATKQFLTQTGTGSVSAAPAWGALAGSDIPNNSANTTGNAATATALAALPTQCAGGQFATGIAASGNANCGTPSGAVTSVGLADASTSPIYTITNSPVTSSGTLTMTFKSETASTFLAAPTGTAGQPSFRAISGLDLPFPSSSVIGGVLSYTSPAHQWINQISTVGSPSSTQPAFSDISGSIAVSQVNPVTGSAGSPTNIGASGGVTATAAVPFQTQWVQGSGGPIVVTANPQISAGTVVGQILYLIGSSDTNSLSISDGSGLSLNGTMVLYNHSAISLIWDGSLWSEMPGRRP